MTLDATLEKLQRLGKEKVRAQNAGAVPATINSASVSATYVALPSDTV
jgi:hypothetical protein